MDRFARYDRNQNFASSVFTAMSDDHSELEPPLPIPNRAVKRLSADDSADYPCESRTSSGTHKNESPGSIELGLLFL